MLCRGKTEVQKGKGTQISVIQFKILPGHWLLLQGRMCEEERKEGVGKLLSFMSSSCVISKRCFQKPWFLRSSVEESQQNTWMG
jgi:hypothetical protein